MYFHTNFKFRDRNDDGVGEWTPVDTDKQDLGQNSIYYMAPK